MRRDPNEELDAPATEAKVRAEILGLKANSALSPDGITNKMLRHLDDDSVSALMEYVQDIWTKGHLPRQWKLANVILMPKPDKPPKL